MQQFDRRRRRIQLWQRCAAGLAGAVHQQRPQPFAAGEYAMAHGIEQTRWRVGRGRGERALQAVVAALAQRLQWIAHGCGTGGGQDASGSRRRSSITLVNAFAEVKKAAPKTYSDTLDGWIRESLAIMKKHGIPGSYDGIHRNIMRESSGNPKAINLWDINAQNGIPSKGLLQVIPPTFEAYHVPGTSKNIYDPVANITAACNYAADRYGSIDNVFGAY